MEEKEVVCTMYISVVNKEFLDMVEYFMLNFKSQLHYMNIYDGTMIMITCNYRNEWQFSQKYIQITTMPNA